MARPDFKVIMPNFNVRSPFIVFSKPKERFLITRMDFKSKFPFKFKFKWPTSEVHNLTSSSFCPVSWSYCMIWFQYHTLPGQTTDSECYDDSFLAHSNPSTILLPIYLFHSWNEWKQFITVYKQRGSPCRRSEGWDLEQDTTASQSAKGAKSSVNVANVNVANISLNTKTSGELHVEKKTRVKNWCHRH